MSLRVRLARALPEALRARDQVATSALRTTLAALDNAEAVPVDDAAERGRPPQPLPVGLGVTEAARRELTEDDVAAVVRAEIAERLEAADQLTAPTARPDPARTDRAVRLRAEAAVLQPFLDSRAD